MPTEGFFSSEELDGFRSTTGVSRCGRCGLSGGCITPRMPASGDGEKGIMVIAEAPGETEDRRGIQLIGDAGKLLETELRRHKVDLHKDCRLINSVNCRPPKNRTPTEDEIDACRPMVWSEIQAFKPKLVLLLGNTAITSYLGHRWKKNLKGVNRWRGYAFPDRENNCWASATFHPSFVLRNSGDRALRVLWHKDIAVALQTIGKALVFPGEHARYVKTLTDEGQTLAFLAWLLKECPSLIAFDYETTGLKPHRAGHRIVSCSVCWAWNRCVSFLMTEKVGVAWARILQDADIRKIIQNGKFELLWSRVYLKSPVRGFIWDTEVNAHLLDNRQFFTGLKFQAFLHYGAMGYDDDISSYLKSPEEENNRFGANGFNALVEPRVVDEIKDKLLLYGGLDSLYTFWLGLDQAKAFGKELLEV